MKTDKSPLGMIVLEMLKSMTHVLVDRTTQKTGINLTIPQFGLLYSINEEKDEVILKDIAEKLGKDMSSVMRMIDLLEKKKMVCRVVDQNDRRKNQLLLTKKSERFITEFRIVENELNLELLEGLADADMQTFFKVINHIKVKSDQLQILLDK